MKIAHKTPWIFAFVFLLLGCASQPTSQTTEQSQKGSKSPKSRASFNLHKFAASQGMDIPITEVGFRQKSFNDCQLPRYLRKAKKCSTQYLNVLNFRMRCRESSGTVESVTQMELTPVQSRQVNWKIAGLKGLTTTTSEGYAQVRFISHRPMGRQQFLISSRGKIMGVSAREVRQFVLPNYWCE